MKKVLFLIIILIIIIAVAIIFWPQIKGLKPVILPAPEKSANNGQLPDNNNEQRQEGINLTNLPLSVPDGFTLSILTNQVAGARDVIKDSLGNIWLSRTSQGAISLITLKDGEFSNISDVLTSLQKPHGLAINPDDPFLLYFTQEDGVYRIHIYSEGFSEKLVDLPTGGRHTTRSLLFGDDGRLYVSIGSSCDTCVEDDARRATIYVMDKDGGNFEPYATGLRNAVFLAKHPQTGEIFVTEMGRDFLGDNLPPDEINVLKRGADYGWPYCYGKQLLDTTFNAGASCQNTEPSFLNLQAHSAPLGLDFFDASWGQNLAYNLLVAYHGSWNRSEPTGYKVVMFEMDKNGQIVNDQPQDFISGWLTASDRSLGRPTGVLIDNHDKVIYIADDKASVIYQLRKN